MTKDDRPIRNGKWRSGQLEAPTYVLYEVFDILTWYGCTLEKLGEFTFRGGLRAFCFSYTREPDRAVDIEPEQFQKLFGDPSMFAVFEGHIGDEEIDEFEQPKKPLRMIPDAVDPEIASRHDGKPIVTSKDVRIWHKVLENFVLQKFYSEAEPGTGTTNGNDGDKAAEAPPPPSDRKPAAKPTNVKHLQWIASAERIAEEEDCPKYKGNPNTSEIARKIRKEGQFPEDDGTIRRLLNRHKELWSK